MKRTKRILSLFLVMVLMLSAMPPITASAAGNDLSAYVTVTSYEIYNEDGTLVDSSDTSGDASGYSNGLAYWKKKNVVIYWELDLPAGTTVTTDDYFKISIFPEGYWTIGDIASTPITVNEIGGNITAGTWSMTSKIATVTLGSNADGKSFLSGTLTTGTICYPNFVVLQDTEKAFSIGDCIQYYKLNARDNSSYKLTDYFLKETESSTNQSISWRILLGRKYLSDRATVASGTQWPGTIDPADAMNDLFVVDPIADSTTISDISIALQARIYAKGPSNSSYEDYSLGSLFLTNISATSKFVNVGTYDDSTYSTLNDFKTYVKAQSNGVGSYGIYHDTSADKYYVVNYFETIPSTNLTYGDLLGTTMGDYLQNKLGSDTIPDADKDWYDTVYGQNDPIYLFRIGVAVTYYDAVLSGSQNVTNGLDFDYTQNGNYITDSLSNPASGYMYAASGRAALPWSSAAIIKYDADGTTGLGGVTFKLQYLDATTNTWVDYTINGTLYEGTTESNGQLIVKDLPEGDYRFVETNAATGYDISTVMYYSDLTDMQAGSNEIIDPNKHFTILSSTDGSYVYATNEKEKYNLTYDANAPAGETTSGSVLDNNTYTYGSSATIESNGFTVTSNDYQFTGWNTEADGSGQSYAGGGSITITGNTTLYAQWSKDNPYMVIYNANGGTGSYTDDNSGNGYASGTNYNVLDLASTGISYAGHTFVGWDTKQDGTGTRYLGASSIDSFDMPASNVTLYAQWEDTTYQVTYDPNGGTGGKTVDGLAYESKHTVLGNASSAANVSRTGFDFNGWNTKADGSGTDYSMNDIITMTEDIVLYAKWKTKG